MALHLKKCLKQFPHNVYPIPKVHTWEKVSIALKIYMKSVNLLWKNKKTSVPWHFSETKKKRSMQKVHNTSQFL